MTAPLQDFTSESDIVDWSDAGEILRSTGAEGTAEDVVQLYPGEELTAELAVDMEFLES